MQTCLLLHSDFLKRTCRFVMVLRVGMAHCCWPFLCDFFVAWKCDFSPFEIENPVYFWPWTREGNVALNSLLQTSRHVHVWHAWQWTEDCLLLFLPRQRFPLQ